MMRIEKAAVLGAGTMGAQIAAHLANAGVPTLLLDIPPRELTPEEQAKGLTLESPAGARTGLRAAGLEAAMKAKPAAFFTPGTRLARHVRKLRRRSREDQRLRSDHRSRR